MPKILDSKKVFANQVNSVSNLIQSIRTLCDRADIAVADLKTNASKVYIVGQGDIEPLYTTPEPTEIRPPEQPPIPETEPASPPKERKSKKHGPTTTATAQMENAFEPEKSDQ
jgi:hypothetical protein